MALIALVAPAARAGVEFVAPIGNCTARVDVIGDGKDLFIIAGPNVQFEVFGNSIDFSDPSSGFRIASDSGAGSVSARIIRRRAGAANEPRGCGNIGSAEVEVDSPIGLTSNIQRSLFFRMLLGDESRLQMTIKAYPVINVLTWTSVQNAVGCIVKTGTFERLDQDHKIRIRLPIGHRQDQTECDQKTLVAQVFPSNIGELDIPFDGSASITGWGGFNYTVAGAPAFLQSSQFQLTQPQFSREIHFGISVSGIRALTAVSNSTITVRSPNPNGSGTLNLEVVPEPNLELLPQVPDALQPPGPSSLTFAPNHVTGGSSSTGQVSFNEPASAAGLAVNLSSAAPAVAAVPESVTVAAGATTRSFAVTTIPVPNPVIVHITATAASGTRTASLTILPPVLSSVSLTPSSVSGGQSSTGQVSLNGPAPAGGREVQLSNSNPAVAGVPTSVTVAAGARTKSFAVPTIGLLLMQSTTVQITASSGGVSRTAQLTVNP